MTTPFQILFVEDEVRHQKVYATAIEEALPVTVLFATNGDEALRLIASDDPPELIVLDLDIPGASGEEVLARVRSGDAARYIPVIILTGQGGTEKQMELLDSGADDFLEKGMAPEILIARLRTQMRHKLAIERLERLALDRDLFAAGVLSDIGGIRGAIVHICTSVRALAAENPEKNRERLLAHLDDLSSVASKLGGYASDVIQSVRDTSRAAEAAPQDLGRLIDWVTSVSTVGEAADALSLRYTLEGPLAPVLADQSFLRLALLNIAQYAQKRGGGRASIQVRQMARVNVQDPMQRTFLTTVFRVPGSALPAKELARLLLGGGAAAYDDQGLGMTLVAKVLAKMGGRAFAEMKDGQLELCLDLPAATAG